jgi:adenosylcobalamin-dependent ribonucleoside-triphosphate reductase
MTSFSFKLTPDFVAGYKDKKPPFGYADVAGNSVGEITFLRTYSRLKEDGTKETWAEVCERVTNGVYSIQKDECKSRRLPWNDAKAQASAKEFFERLFDLKWTPPGRGLWVMGTAIVNEQKNSAALQNCAFVSTNEMTKLNPAKPFGFLMEASMLGVGVGFDDKGADKGFEIFEPTESVDYVIPDTREGWADSTTALINSFLKADQKSLNFNYDAIRPFGASIKTFGGVASGPAPLIKLHERIRNLFAGRKGELLTRVDLADIGNQIGACVVSGNVRRSAELLIGHIDDQNFLNLKNWEKFPTRNDYSDPENPGWGYMSNNSVEASVGTDFSPIVEGIALNGEPGVVWMDMSRKYGRLADGVTNKDWRVVGYNPCAEQSLESFEMCTLVETYLNRHESLDDFKRTLKFAYLYAKTVTLLPTHWEDTNAIMQRNRRIGTSVSGVANFADDKGLPVLRQWLDEGYATVQAYDQTYSEWLGIRESIKTTTVKPSGTVSILAGESPGVHWTAGGKFFKRAIRFANNDPMLALFKMANYTIELDVTDSGRSVVYFPIKSQASRSEKEVSIYEKIDLASTLQHFWSDNSVSVTITFDADKEKDDVERVLHMYDGKLKTVSFLPMGNTVYPQQPYTQITEEEYLAYEASLFPIDLAGIYMGLGIEAIGENYCSTDACEIKLIRDNQ